MLSPNMVQKVWEQLERAGAKGSAFAGIAGLNEQALAALAVHINGLLSADPRQWPVEVLADHEGIGRVNVEVLHEAGFRTLGDLIDPKRVGWRYTDPPELKDLRTWGTKTIRCLREYLADQGLLSRP